uniref:V-type proton ATPase subunit E n=1 Tax=Noctiluca scintillans TaxID=2966 RepID=A0A7S1FAL2_NOCSC
MDPNEAASQIEQMRNFILNEAKDKAEEIDLKSKEEFQIEKFKIVDREKQRIRADTVRKLKQLETKQAIDRSTAINHSRLKRILRQAQAVEDISSLSKESLRSKSCDKQFVERTLAQGLLALLEEEVVVQCREADLPLVEQCLAPACKLYSDTIQEQTGATKGCTLTIDKSRFLSKDKLGGVVLSCQNNKIVIDNTADLRLSLVLEQDKPAIKKLLFP